MNISTEIAAESVKEMNSGYFLYDKKGEIAILKLTCPGKINQFSSDVLKELQRLLLEIEKDSEIKAIIFTGRDKAFAAGANIKEMQGISSKDGFELAKLGQETFNMVENSKKLTIAANNGVALGGGCELCLACDFRIAVQSAKYGQPEVNLGLIPGWGGTRRLSRFIGATKALELILTGKLMSAQEALELGLLNAIVPDEVNIVEEAMKLAKEVTSKSSVVIQYAKEAFKAGLLLPDKDAENTERKLFGKCFDLEDCKEGINAFLDKREAHFKNK